MGPDSLKVPEGGLHSGRFTVTILKPGPSFLLLTSPSTTNTARQTHSQTVNQLTRRIGKTVKQIDRKSQPAKQIDRKTVSQLNR